jgi:hypothetical protein
MFTDEGGWLWLVIDVLLVAALAGALVYATVSWSKRRRNPATERASREATKEMYHHDEAEAAARAEGRPTIETTAPSTPQVDLGTRPS